MVRDSLFYAANFEPEVVRMFKAYDASQKDVAEKFKERALAITDEILTKKEFSSAGREEWFSVRNLLLGYDQLDAYARQVLLTFGRPFSYKFANTR